jgi:CheY-like chemotaxis protein
LSISYTAVDAENLLDVFEYDLIILDWGLPDVSGDEVCKRFRARKGNTPVLMLTGKNRIGEKTAGLDGGADDYLTKPFDSRATYCPRPWLCCDVREDTPITPSLMARSSSIQWRCRSPNRERR